MVDRDRSQSIEQGLALGYRYAEKHRDDRLSLRAIARARSAADAAAKVDDDEIATETITDPVGFWSGFSHGVARYLLAEGHALLDPS